MSLRNTDILVCAPSGHVEVLAASLLFAAHQFNRVFPGKSRNLGFSDSHAGMAERSPCLAQRLVSNCGRQAFFSIMITDESGCLRLVVSNGELISVRFHWRVCVGHHPTSTAGVISLQRNKQIL